MAWSPALEEYLSRTCDTNPAHAPAHLRAEVAAAFAPAHTTQPRTTARPQPRTATTTTSRVTAATRKPDLTGKVILEPGQTAQASGVQADRVVAAAVVAARESAPELYPAAAQDGRGLLFPELDTPTRMTTPRPASRVSATTPPAGPTYVALNCYADPDTLEVVEPGQVVQPSPGAAAKLAAAGLISVEDTDLYPAESQSGAGLLFPQADAWRAASR